MILKKLGIELHNVAALEELDGLPDLALSRYPAKVCKVMTERGKFIATESVGCEIRLVTDSANVRLYLTSSSGGALVWVYRGDFWTATVSLEEGRTQCIHAIRPENLSQLKSSAFKKNSFSPSSRSCHYWVQSCKTFRFAWEKLAKFE